VAEIRIPAAVRTTSWGLFVAGRGSGLRDGLHRWVHNESGWQGSHLDTVTELSALAAHPFLPVIYGVSGVGEDGWIRAWDISGDRAVALNVIESQGAEPCHLALDLSGRLLVVTNYTSSTLAVQKIAADGSFMGELRLIHLSGSSVELDRQQDAHPHQAVFDGERLYVTDLGADLLREFHVDLDGKGPNTLLSVRDTPLPAGSGPRHVVVLPGGRVALSGELGSTLIIGRPGGGAETWSHVPSTGRSGPAKTRHTRNYPGDIQASPDGRLVYLANRGYDTIATFSVVDEKPRLISEIDAGVTWPQHLLLRGENLLVAGCDSSQVVTIPLFEGVPTEPTVLFDCPGACWLLPDTAVRVSR
jgi:6-phosphogluconolactonase